MSEFLDPVIAIQDKGKNGDAKLALESEAYLRESGMRFEESETETGREFCVESGYELLRVRSKDIAPYVGYQAAKLGITGLDQVAEQAATCPNVVVAQKLGFGRCTLTFAAPEESGITTLRELNGLRVATSNPNVVRRFAEDEDLDITILTLSGGVEQAPRRATPTGVLADAICDLKQTGGTMDRYGLRPIESIFDSEAVLIFGKVYDLTDADYFGCINLWEASKMHDLLQWMRGAGKAEAYDGR